jgi:hypothetical protein
MIRTYDHLHEPVHTSQSIMTGVRFRGFHLMQLRFSRCSPFYSNSPLHDSVVRPSSRANTCVSKYHDWREVQGFPSTASLFQYLLTTLFQFSATSFGRTTIFKCQHIHHDWREVQEYSSKQLCSNSFSVFYSQSPLHVSVVRPSSFANIYITNYHDWREVKGFLSNATLFQ